MSRDKPERLAIDGEGIRIGIVAARYNFELVNALLESVLQTLDAAGVRQEEWGTFRVAGSNEIPPVAALLGKTGDFDAVIGLGLVIAGETDHHTIIGQSTANALHMISVRFETPIINGILTVNSLAQAEARITGELCRGPEFAHAALEMARLSAELQQRLFDNDFADALDDLDWIEEDDEEDDNHWRK